MSGSLPYKAGAAGVKLVGLTKKFGTRNVISSLDLDIKPGEFLVLLGPSGCGKSTMLRLIAGLETVSEGQVLIDDKDVTNKSPRQRGIAMVFQSYALYAHLSVQDNISFPLKMKSWHWWYEIPAIGKHFPGARKRLSDYRKKAAKVAKLVGLSDYLDHKPGQLSGGQRQRVALARAMIHKPSVYLMDEPLSNLDAQLRTQTRAEIIRLYKQVGKTFIYVTHDQIEAMTMSTRVIVLNEGKVQQDGTPDELYEIPANIFVAGFIGSPPMNLINANVFNDSIRIGSTVISGSELLAKKLNLDGEIIFGIRPEGINFSDSGIPAAIDLVERIGTEQIITLDIQDNKIMARLTSSRRYEIGEKVNLEFDFEFAHLFDKETGQRI